MSDKKYYIKDQETGEPHEVTKEVYDHYQSWLRIIKPEANIKISDELIMGTGSDSFKGNPEALFHPSVFKRALDPVPPSLARYFTPQYHGGGELDEFGGYKEYLMTPAEVVERFGNQQHNDMTDVQAHLQRASLMIEKTYFENMTPEKRQKLHEMCTRQINENIAEWKDGGALHNAKDISDGFHTFGELYEFRLALTVALFKQIARDKTHRGQPNPTWRSKLHSDGTMFDGFFIVGMDTWTNEGELRQITFHYTIEAWDLFDFAEVLEKAPEWDGHTSKDVLERLKAL